MSTGEMASDVTMLAEIRPAHDPMATNIYLSGKKKNLLAGASLYLGT